MADYMKNIVMGLLRRVLRLISKAFSYKTKCCQINEQLLEENATLENKDNILIKENTVLQNEKNVCWMS